MKRPFAENCLAGVILLCAVSCVDVETVHDAGRDEKLLRDSVSFYKSEGKRLRNSAVYQEALAMHRRGLEVARELCDTHEVVQALNNIGTVYRRMGLLEDAASWHYKALALCEEYSDMTTPTAVKDRVISLNGIGNIHLSMGNNDIALDSFREALKGETSLGSATGMAINYANIGAIMEDDGQTDSARWYYSQSLKCNEESGNRLGMSLCYNHFGRLSEMSGDYEDAFREYSKAYGILSGGADKWHWLQSCTALARVSLKTGRYYQAGRYIEDGIGVAESAGSLAHIAELRHLDYELNRRQRNYVRALESLEKYIEVSDSLTQKRNEEKIYSMRAGYEQERSRSEMNHMRQLHSQENRRNALMLNALVAILFLAVAGIMVLVYALRLRSRNHKMLAELDQTRSNYFTNIAHEFRTPLTVILSAAGSIRNNTAEEGTLEDAEDILSYSRELLNLVTQVLEVARMTSSLAPQPKWCSGDIAGYITAIAERYEKYAEEKGISLVRDFGTGELEMDFAPDLMNRIVGNLLSNAVKYSRRGTSVTLGLGRRHIRGAEYIVISVRDQGEGMSEARLEEIFKPFRRFSHTGNEMSTGIGLYVVKLSVEAMSGSIDVRSVPGEGSEFDICIPIRHDMASGPLEKQCAYEAEPVSAGPVVNGSVMSDDEEAPHILIVEDHPEVARWEMRHLDPQYSFHFAGNGAEGLELAEEIVPDLIITDVMMPVMDGLEFCRRIRSSELLSHIPVVMVTAKATQDDRLKGLEAGADAYLEKPYDEGELALRVKSLLEQRKRLRLRYSGMASVQECAGEARSHTVVEQVFLDKFSEALETAFARGKVDCEVLAAELCVGRVQLNRKIKAITGCKTTEYIHALRIAKAKELLDSTALSVGDVALKCGVEDVGYFSTLFRKTVGMTPTAYRNR